jgi:hypothetical protein
MMSILKKLELFRELNGYLGVSVFSPDGNMLGGVTEVSGMNFEIAGSLIHDAYLFTQNKSQEAGFGNAEMLQIETDRGIVLVKCFKENNRHFHTILVIQRDANVALAKVMMNKVTDVLKDEF